MSRAKGSRRTCDAHQARQRLVDARQFLEAAELLDAPDVVATNAIHAAIDGNHNAAVDLLRQVDPGLATTLKRALDRKTQAAYESSDISNSDAVNCVKWAKQLLAGAEARLQS